MTEQRFQLAEKLRTYISKYGINDFNEEHLQKVGLTLEELKEWATAIQKNPNAKMPECHS